MSEHSPSDLLLKLALMFLGLGFISTPFIAPRLAVSLGEQAQGGSPLLCPDGLSVQPYCGSNLAGQKTLSGTSLIADFYGLTDPVLAASACNDSIRVLIATVPDPVSSQLGTSFDTFIYSLTRAHETLGYVLDRFWLPWPVPGQGAVKAETPNPLQMPGVMLFRTTSPLARPRLSLVYLVGETPTRGIHKDALRAALLNVQRLRTGCWNWPVDIVGPVFSGSTQSLLLALRPVEGTFPDVRIVSGTASSDANIGLRNKGRTFEATVHSNAALEGAVDVVLHRMGIDPRRVARLVERGTAYGQAFETHPDSGLTLPFPMSIATIREQFEAAAKEAEKRGSKEGAELGSRVAISGERQVQGGDKIPIYSQATVASQEILFDQLARLLAQRRIRMVGLLATDIRDKLFLAKELRTRLPNLQFYTIESNVLYLRSDYREATRGMIVISTYPLIPEFTRDSQFARRASENLGPTDGYFGIYNATLIALGRDYLVKYPSGSTIRDSTRSPPVWVTVVGAGSIEPLTIMRDTATKVGQPYTHPALLRATVSPVPYRRLWLVMFVFAGFSIAMQPLRRFRRMFRKVRQDRKRRTGRTFSLKSLAEIWRGSLPPPPNVVEAKFRHEHVWYRAEARVFDSAGRLLLAAALVPSCIVLVAGATTPPTHDSLGAVLASVPVKVWLAAMLPVVLCLSAALLDIWVLPRNSLDEVFKGAPLGDNPERAIRGFFYLAVLALLVWTGSLTYEIIRLPADESARTLFWDRGRSLSSLTSPLLPIVLVGLTCFFWCAWHRKRSDILWHATVFETNTTPTNWPREGGYQKVWDEMRLATKSFRRRLSLVTPNLRAVGVLLVMGLVTILLGMSVFPSQESVASPGVDYYFRRLLWFGIIGGFTLTLISADRVLQLWQSLKWFLVWTERLPLRTAFDRLPPQVSRLTQLTPVKPRWDVWREWQNQRWQQLSNLAQPDSLELSPREHVPEWSTSLRLQTGERRFAAVAERLDYDWEAEPDSTVVADVALALKELKDIRPVADPQAGSISTQIRQSASYRERLWMRAAEEYVAADIVDYVDWAVNGLRWLALFLVGALICTTFLLFSYPIPQERFVGTLFLAIFLLTVGTLAVLVIDMNRNPMMSRITGTRPGRLSWDRSLATNIIVLVGLPVLSYLGAAVPGLGDIVFGWVEPLVRSLSR